MFRRNKMINPTTNISTKEIWLTYFNNVLYEKGIITEKEKNKMTNLIYQKYHNESGIKVS